MSSHGAHRGRHAAPNARSLPSGRVAYESTARRLAAAAAAITAGALPLGYPSNASAATTHPAGSPDLALFALPINLPGAPEAVAAEIPLSSDLPLSSALGTANLAKATDQLLKRQARRAGAQLAEALPLPRADVLPQLAAAQLTTSSGGALPLVPQTLHEGALGKLTTGFTPPVDALITNVVGRAAPLAARLRQDGVPTVGDLTGRLSGTPLPMVGSVGDLTRTLPVSSALGSDSPVTTALEDVSSL